MAYEFSNLYRPVHPKSTPEPKQQKLQITHISPDKDVLIVKHLTEKGGFRPLTRAVRCIRASSLGAECDSDLWLSIQGYEPRFSVDVLNIFDVGTAMEPFILSWMQDQLEWEVHANSRDEEGVIMAVSGGLITGHIDAIARNRTITGDAWAICDAKTMNINNYEKWGREGTEVSKPNYDVQLETYAYAYSRFLDLRYKALTAMNKNNSSFSVEVTDRNQSRWEEVIRPKAERFFKSDLFIPQKMGGADGIQASRCDLCARRYICVEAARALTTGKVPAGKRNPSFARVPPLSDNGDILQVLANVYELYDRNMNLILPGMSLQDSLRSGNGETLEKLAMQFHDDIGPVRYPGTQAEPEEHAYFDLPF